MTAGFDGDLDLGDDPVIGGNEHRIAIAAGLEIEEGAEPAECRIRTRPPGRAGERPDRLDQRVAGRNINARIGIADGLLDLCAVAHAVSLPQCFAAMPMPARAQRE